MDKYVKPIAFIDDEYSPAKAETPPVAAARDGLRDTLSRAGYLVIYGRPGTLKVLAPSPFSPVDVEHLRVAADRLNNVLGMEYVLPLRSIAQRMEDNL